MHFHLASPIRSAQHHLPRRQPVSRTQGHAWRARHRTTADDPQPPCGSYVSRVRLWTFWRPTATRTRAAATQSLRAADPIQSLPNRKRQHPSSDARTSDEEERVRQGYEVLTTLRRRGERYRKSSRPALRRLGRPSLPNPLWPGVHGLAHESGLAQARSRSTASSIPTPASGPRMPKRPKTMTWQAGAYRVQRMVPFVESPQHPRVLPRPAA